MQRFDPEHERPIVAADAPLALWIRVLSRFPMGLLYALGAAIMFVLRYVVLYRVRIARSNLRRCFPDRSAAQIESILNAYYRHLGQVAAEIVKFAAMTPDDMRRRVRFTNAALIAAETDAGRSVLLLAAHLGNWEWSLQAVTLMLGVPIDAAYKPLHAAGADRQLLNLRSRFGARMVAAKKLLRVVARHRNQQHAVALMADQMPASSGARQWVSFLGRDTAFYPGPAQIGRVTGYATFFVGMRRVSLGHYEMSFEPMYAAGERAAPEVFTARYAQLLEAAIRAEPAIWMWTHRRWKSTPPSASASASANAAPEA